MTDITFRSDFTVELVDSMGNDDAVLRAMLISTLKDESVSEMPLEAKLGKIRFLMKNRHGTPFEHNSMTFRSEAPIFVYREWHRHRIGISINEQSGRYVELPPMFYVPPAERPLMQVGKPGHYEYVAASPGLYEDLVEVLQGTYANAYDRYQYLLKAGVAKEVATHRPPGRRLLADVLDVQRSLDDGVPLAPHQSRTFLDRRRHESVREELLAEPRRCDVSEQTAVGDRSIGSCNGAGLLDALPADVRSFL